MSGSPQIGSVSEASENIWNYFMKPTRMVGCVMMAHAVWSHDLVISNKHDDWVDIAKQKKIHLAVWFLTSTYQITKA